MSHAPARSQAPPHTARSRAVPFPALDERPRKVLFVFGSLARAGAQLRNLEVCRELRRQHAIQFDFCFLGLGPNELQDEIAAVGGSSHLVRIRSPRFLVEFSSLLRAGRYDVVSSEPRLLSGIIAWLAARQGVPTRIVAIRNSIGDAGRLTASSHAVRVLLSSRLFVWTTRRLIKRYATHVVAVSRSALDSVFPLSWQTGVDCRVVYNGIDLSPFQGPIDAPGVRREFGWPAESRIVVNVGRLSAQKNHTTILRAMRLVYEKDRSVRLLLVGGGKLYPEVNSLIDDSGLREMCAITSNRADVPRLLLASDVFFFPSAWEGLPGAALEALAAGLPLVTSDIPSIREIAPYFPGSILAAQSYDAGRHAEHIEAALQMPKDRGRTQERFAVSPFFLESSVEAHRSLYGLG